MEIEEEEKIIPNLDNFLEILGNPTRRIILSKLAKVPHGASELARSLSISRQAVHSQLDILLKYNIIEKIGKEPRGLKYRIKNNLSLRFDLSPDYYNVEYNHTQIEDDLNTIELKDMGCDVDYKKIDDPNEKLRFLGEQIKEIEQNISDLEEKRRELLQNKECFIVELKNIMREKYDQQLRKEQPNLEKEIFFTLFYNPMKYLKRINIDSLLEDMFFSDIDSIRRDQHRVSIKHLLRDLSKFMDFLKEDEDDWIFDI